jgi:hypothetical protein
VLRQACFKTAHDVLFNIFCVLVMFFIICISRSIVLGVLPSPKLLKVRTFCSQVLVQNSLKLFAATKLYDCIPYLSISLMMNSAENPLQFVATLRFFTLAPIGPLINADHH